VVTDPPRLSRISKLLADRDDLPLPDALRRRQAHRVTLMCGQDVASSYTLQLAVLTATVVASRCFPGAVVAALDERTAAAPLRVWPRLGLTLGQALLGVGAALTTSGARTGGSAVVFGDAAVPARAQRVTFDGWIAATGPAALVDRLREREFCPLSGVLAGSLAVSEVFMSFAQISIEATRRQVALSLWRPEADIRSDAAQGVPVQVLPKELWALGLGHLGNAYLWTLAGLPYARAAEVKVFLADFDEVEPENADAGVLFTANTRGLKTRVCGTWLEERGFRTRLVERRLDARFRRGDDEPGLALCGFDSNPARRGIAPAEFLRVIESGLGDTADNFDTISLHTLPNARSASELWPDASPEEQRADIARRQRIARESTAYAGLGDECGRFELAGKAVAVPFVGMAAASFVVAEALRLYHDGPAYADFKLRLATPSDLSANTSGLYSIEDIAQLPYAQPWPDGHGAQQ
jgi:hypothetical protein